MEVSGSRGKLVEATGSSSSGASVEVSMEAEASKVVFGRVRTKVYRGYLLCKYPTEPYRSVRYGRNNTLRKTLVRFDTSSVLVCDTFVTSVLQPCRTHPRHLKRNFNFCVSNTCVIHPPSLPTFNAAVAAAILLSNIRSRNRRLG